MSKAKAEKSAKQDLLDTITPDDALQILRTICAEDKEIAEKIERVANEYLRDVDIDQIAEDVKFELDGLEVEDLWDRSGPSREGYSEPGEMAYEMLEEELEPFLAQIRKYHKLAKPNEAKLYCMGLLKGISQYEKESKSEFKGWAGDGVGECLQWVFLEWEKGNQSTDDLKEMKRFMENWK